MASLIGSKSLPPGFRFYPTDEELIMFYLKRKVLGKSIHPKMISEVDVYRFAPWDLPNQSCLKTKDLNWYFFCPRSKKYANGGRASRSSECGFWKATGYDRTIKYNHRPVGKIKTLIFHLGKAPHGERTDWVIHEYRLEDKVLGEKGVPQDAYVICKVYKKSGLGPKNGEDYGAPFVEEEWESDDDDDDDKMLTADSGFASHPQNHSTAVTANTLSITSHSTSATDQQMSSVADTSKMSASHVKNTAAIAVSTPSKEQLLTSAVDACNVAELAGSGTTIPFAASETEEDELGRLLASFTEDDEVPTKLFEEVFGNVKDLPDFWSQFTGFDKDYCIELNDLK